MAAADKKALPVVFLDIKIGDAASERIEILLRADVVPKTAGNFFHLCKGDKNGLTFKNSPFHRIINGFMAQGGDITSGDGYGGESIYGRTFPDENFKLKHTGRGVLSCANAGADTNGSQFFLCFRDTPHLDGAHVVFGNVLKNMDLLDKLEAVGQRSGVPKKKVTVVDCGVVVEGDYDI